MIQVYTMYIFLLVVCMTGSTLSCAMESHTINRTQLAKLMNETMKTVVAESQVDAVSEAALALIKEKAAIIAQEVNMPNRTNFIAETMVMAKYQLDSQYKEPDFSQRSALSQQKEWENSLSYYTRPLPYDCTVLVKKKSKTGDIDVGECHTIHARSRIKDAHEIILPAIRDYTRDFSKRPDGKLNADQEVECTITFGDSPSEKHIFTKRAGDAWQEIEKKMQCHLDDYTKS